MIISDNFNRFFETFGGASPFGVKSGFGAEVVDFRGFSGYFSIVADISHAFFQTGKTCLADAHFEPDKIFSVVSYLDNRRAIARMLEFFVVSV